MNPPPPTEAVNPLKEPPCPVICSVNAAHLEHTSGFLLADLHMPGMLCQTVHVSSMLPKSCAMGWLSLHWMQTVHVYSMRLKSCIVDGGLCVGLQADNSRSARRLGILLFNKELVAVTQAGHSAPPRCCDPHLQLSDPQTSALRKVCFYACLTMTKVFPWQRGRLLTVFQQYGL